MINPELRLMTREAMITISQCGSDLRNCPAEVHKLIDRINKLLLKDLSILQEWLDYVAATRKELGIDDGFDWARSNDAYKNFNKGDKK